jgi:uncharacterized protein
MPATGLLALLDDVTAILDDVAVMSKLAFKKTAGIAGDDLAVNAQGLVGIDPSRELPIVWKVALGSGLNKIVLIPLALLLPDFIITPLLMLGGAFLCYEGLHKILHKKDEADEAHHAKLVEAIKAGPEALKDVEKQKVKQAIFTDIILSAEIVAVALGAITDKPLSTKAVVLTVVGFGMTIAIYGLVALMVKLDDIGLYLQTGSAEGSFKQRLGKLLVDGTPKLMRVISVVGTVAMFLVGGGILSHGVHSLEEAINNGIAAITSVGFLQGLLGMIATILVGVVVGGVALLLIGLVRKIVGAVRKTDAKASH